REHRVVQLELLARTPEELRVLRDRSGPAALDVADPQLVEQGGDGELVRDGQVHALLLRSVAQGRVVDVERRPRGLHGHGGLLSALPPTAAWCGSRARRRSRRRGLGTARCLSDDASGGGGPVGSGGVGRAVGGARTNKKTPRGYG